MLEKKYDHKLVEDGKYESWVANNYFEAGDKSKEPFCIVIPPPNVTGKLHIGHAWDTAIQDAIISFLISSNKKRQYQRVLRKSTVPPFI